MEEASLLSLRRLLDTRPVAALATLHQGDPAASMVPFVLQPRADPPRLLIHVSALAPHTADLHRHPRVGLLVTADPGTVQPVQALPRVAFQADAQPLSADDPGWSEARDLYLGRFPDAAVTFELADFTLVALVPRSARLVAGFGRAQALTGPALQAWLRQPA